MCPVIQRIPECIRDRLCPFAEFFLEGNIFSSYILFFDSVFSERAPLIVVSSKPDLTNIVKYFLSGQLSIFRTLHLHPFQDKERQCRKTDSACSSALAMCLFYLITIIRLSKQRTLRLPELPHHLRSLKHLRTLSIIMYRSTLLICRNDPSVYFLKSSLYVLSVFRHR